MSDFALAVVPWFHPALGLVTVTLALRAARLGLRSREGGRQALGARAAHRALTPWVYGLVVTNWSLGLLTVVLVRPNLEAAASGHFAVGTVILMLFTVAALLSRWVPVDARARTVHPWVGGTALLLMGVQIFLGLQIMRW